MDMPSFEGEEVDVCVVGSGAGGAPLATQLAMAGARVVILEKGPWYKQEDFDHDEIKNCRRNYWAPYPSDEPHLLQRPGDRKPRVTNSGWTSNCVGGGTVHMSGFFYRLSPEDFTLGTRYANGVEGANITDWPIRYEDLAPYYDRVEREIGVSGKAGDTPFEPPRSGPYPFDPLRANPLHALVEQGAKEKGYHPFHTPRGIISRPFKGRGACVYCDFCGSYGCESGAKSSTLAALIPAAIETGRCEVRPHSMVYEVVADKEGRVTGVRYFDHEGKPHQQKARVVVVSATAVESARLLLNSKSSRFPRGLANNNGQVGKNLMFSTLGKGYAEFEVGKLPQKLREHDVNHFLQRSLRDLYFLSERAGEYDKGGVVNYLLPHRNPIFTAERLAKRHKPPLWGQALQREIWRYYQEVREIEFEVYGEFLPNADTFISVDGKVRDRWGIPSATMHVANHPEDRKNSKLVVDHALEVLDAAGASKTAPEAVGGTTYILQHGTCRMGDDAETSVLDRWCRAHEVPNLYVVDGSFMPSSGGVPTTLTIMANSLRVADHLIARFKKREISSPSFTAEP